MQRASSLLLALGVMSAGVGMGACGSDDDPAKPDPCSNGLCTGAGGATGAGGNATTGSMTTSSGGCVEAWLCTPWETNGSDDSGTRTCTDQNSCGTTALKPVEAATLPPLDFNFYRCNVEPIMDRKCSQLGCHGTEQGRALRIYARGRLRIDEDVVEPDCLMQGTVKNLAEVCIGSIECACWSLPHTATEFRKNYDAARGFGLNPDGSPIGAGMEATSELLAQPVVGGKAHAGIHLFKSGDAEYQAVAQWLGGATLGACNTTN
jgi:hypothetical protein